MVHALIPTLELTALDSMNIANPCASASALESLAVTVELAHYAKPGTGSIARLGPGATYHFENLPFDYDEPALLNAAERDRAKLSSVMRR